MSLGFVGRAGHSRATRPQCDRCPARGLDLRRGEVGKQCAWLWGTWQQSVVLLSGVRG